MRRNLSAAALIAALVGVPGPAAAAPKSLGAFGAWSAYVLSEGSAKTCYLHGEPKSSTGAYKKRGAIYVQVTHRPAAGTTNEVGVTAGYTYRKESEVEIEIGGRTFTLFTDRDTAWAREKSDDRALVAAMKAGHTMVVRGTSSRATPTADTYSLNGFTAAHAAIGKACGVK